MTISDLLADKKYTKKTILQKFIMHYVGLTKEELRTQDNYLLSADQLQAITSAYHQYVDQKRPLEYILGYVEFFEHTFVVNEHTLIPRPETEYMIDAVREYTYDALIHGHSETEQAMLLDIGTGCGVLGLSVLLQCPDVYQQAVLTDISSDALTVAHTNYDTYKKHIVTPVKLLESSLLDFVQDHLLQGSIVLVANLPYIPEQTFVDNVSETVKNWEPKMAFVGGDDGLDWYRKMLDQWEILCIKQEVTMFLEMMTWQVDILRKEYPQRCFSEAKTFHFNIRIVKVYKK